MGLFLLFPTATFAHLAGQPPFFKINGRYSNLYPVPTTSLTDFSLPQDLAAENYVVNQPLNFEMVTDMLPVPKDIVAQSHFFWNLGDGTKASGLTNTHAYSKAGSYLLTIDAQAPGDPKPQLLQSVQFNILPNVAYKLPQAIIKVNGKSSKDPLTDVLHANFNSEVQFDASATKQGSGNIVSYFWDFGDGNSASGIKASHSYASDLTQTFVVLRTKNADGFIVDNYVEVDNQNTLSENPRPTSNNQVVRPDAKKAVSEDPKNKIVVGAIIFIVGVGAIIGAGIVLRKVNKK